jgi:hypothetical protein
VQDAKKETDRSTLQSIAGEAMTDPWKVSSLSDKNKLDAIQCFLSAEGDKRKALIGGVTRYDVSQTFALPDVELAALYAISYIYTGRYDHASAIALRGSGAYISDKTGDYVTSDEAVKRAYSAYREWFNRLHTIGFTAAKSANLQPLDGTGLSWY